MAVSKVMAAKGLSSVPGLTLADERSLVMAAVMRDLADERLSEDLDLRDQATRVLGDVEKMLEQVKTGSVGLVISLVVGATEKGDPYSAYNIMGSGESLHMAAEVILASVVESMAQRGACPCENCLVRAKSEAGEFMLSKSEKENLDG